jgi:hypothetical protein
MRARTSAVEVGLAAALAVVAIRLAWLSRDWPLIHDAPVMHYIAWLIERGAVPYRDVFDMNAPGIYVLHWAVLRGLGGGAVAWRVFDLGWLALTALLLAWYARPFGAFPAAVAGLLFAVYHLAGGVWLAGQRDFLACAFLVAGAGLVASAGGLARPILAGVAAGVSVAVKPPAGLFMVVLAVAAALAARREGRRWWPASLAVVASGAVAPLACLGWLAATGGLGAFVAVFWEYVLPLYSRLARVAPWTALGWWPSGYAVWALFAVLVACACAVSRWDLRRGLVLPDRPARARLVHRVSRWDLRRGLALAGVGYGVDHFVIQGKGWEYQLYPLAVFASLAAGLAFAASWRPARWIAALALALLALQLYAKGLDETHPPWIAAKAARVRAIVGDLRGRLGPADTVQVLDTSEGGIDALYVLGVREPTRFIYDFHFFHDEDRPVIRRLRAEFLAALAARRPAFIVLLERGWPAGGYERLARFPGLANWMATEYRLDREGDGYRIYAERAGS